MNDSYIYGSSVYINCFIVYFVFIVSEGAMFLEQSLDPLDMSIVKPKGKIINVSHCIYLFTSNHKLH